MRSVVIEIFRMICLRHQSVLSREIVWHLDTLLGVVWDSFFRVVDDAENVTTDDFVFLNESLIEDGGKLEKLLEELRVLYWRLEDMGITKEMVRQMLCDKENISRMFVLRDGRIELPDYGVVVTLPPLQWVLYMLFLRHEEGIAYKNLVDYRDELMEMLVGIYRRDDGLVNEARLRRMVDRLTDSTGGAINETVSKIRRAFIDAIGSEDKARHYIINGSRGGVRRICIDRAFVVIE